MMIFKLNGFIGWLWLTSIKVQLCVVLFD